jgi:iron complex outermembrane receptor protein
VPSSFIGTGTFVPSATNAPNAPSVTQLFNGYGVAGNRTALANWASTTMAPVRSERRPELQGTQTVPMAMQVMGTNVRMPVGQQIQVLNALERKTGVHQGRL